MKKIAIVTRCMHSGGAERVIWRLMQYFLEKKYDVHLILMEAGHPIFYKIPKECDLTVISCKSSKGFAKKIESYYKLRKIIKKSKADIVLSLPEDIGIYVILSLIGKKVPVVVSERNNPWVMPFKKSTRFLRKLMYPKAAGLIFQTKQAASFFSDKLQKKSIILPNPLDTENLPEPYIGEREKIIAGAGRLDPQKNFKLLIDSFAEFYKTHEDYKLVIYGEGSKRSELEQLAESKNLPAGTITMPGRVENLTEKLRTKSMFILSSDYEGMPNVVIEAMAVGVPVISTDCPSGGSAELIENGENGILVPVGDVNALCAAMCKLVDSPDLVMKFEKNGVAIREKLNSNVVADQWREYLENVVRKQS